MLKRINFNIPGFKKLIPDGIIDGDAILITGTCGTGKTVLALSMTLSSNEPTVYMTLEETENQIITNAKAIGFDPEKRIKEKKLKIIRYDPFRLQDIIDMLKTNVAEISAKFVVIDSISALLMHIHEESEIRRIILEIIHTLRSRNCITILISESIDQEHTSRFHVEEFVVDVVIVLKKSETSRLIRITKCRATKHELKDVLFTVSSSGVKIG